MAASGLGFGSGGFSFGASSGGASSGGASSTGFSSGATNASTGGSSTAAPATAAAATKSAVFSFNAGSGASAAVPAVAAATKSSFTFGSASASAAATTGAATALAAVTSGAATASAAVTGSAPSKINHKPLSAIYQEWERVDRELQEKFREHCMQIHEVDRNGLETQERIKIALDQTKRLELRQKQLDDFIRQNLDTQVAVPATIFLHHLPRLTQTSGYPVVLVLTSLPRAVAAPPRDRAAFI
eukprot:SAG11_NODE_3859_length_2188_cov_1.328865_2_plen_243_part_00